MSTEKNTTKVADSYEEFEIVKSSTIIEDPYKNINALIELVEILIDKRKLNNSCESNRGTI
jgi:hypothetical protein